MIFFLQLQKKILLSVESKKPQSIRTIPRNRYYTRVICFEYYSIVDFNIKMNIFIGRNKKIINSP